MLTDRSRIDTHIKPLMGTMKVPSVTREDVERFMHRIAEGATRKRVKTGRKRGLSNVRGGKGTASRTVGLLSAIFTYAQRKRMITEHPVRGVIRYADRRRQRRLSDDEYAALGRALAAAAAPSRGDGIMTGFPAVFERIAKKGGLPKDITPHILRHSFASLAADLGCSELAIATLLGHRAGSVTARYTHAADDVLLSIADRVAAATLRKLDGERSAVVVQGPRAGLVVA